MSIQFLKSAAWRTSPFFTGLLFTGLFSLGFLSSGLCARSFALSVVDDSGQRITLENPAARIVSLAPHATELLFSAGVGDRVVGVVEYSNYPEQAKRIPQIGSSNQFDFERIAQLKPDLIVGWQSGNPANLVARLRRMGFAVYLSEPRTLNDITSNIERLAQLGGSEQQANKVISDFEETISQLRLRYSGEQTVTVFYEIWNEPLMTLGGKHLFSELLSLCGGKNIFSDVTTLAPQIGREAVIARNPRVILASGMGSERPEWLDEWKKWQSLDAVKHNHLYFIHPDFLQRASLRLAIGAEKLCTVVDAARSSKP